ncbi:D-alanyl-D-alanine carboxypeptidase/D-alanyl-D-alanine-endopeptidase [Gallaecimonas sp. GXIMD1310]|uniref:D-alanyl-D-alanine carboxypeptidase/D-alanyl-D-alanine endopeptidase n=1 Tax=Gallaecimonas sp. GXIMD1310 TaxID=3131926 RepID=UPI0032563C8F
MKRFLLCMLLTLPVTALAQDWFSGRPPGSQVALVVSPLDGGTLTIDHRSHVLLPPASTQKLLTATAAELALGKSYRFNTVLAGRGGVQGDRWIGNLRLTFNGAPDFTRKQLRALLGTLRDMGVNEITGDIQLDGRHFSGYDRAPGWPWDNLGVCYSAPASAIILDHNCVAASLTVSRAGIAPHFFVPPFQPVSVDNQVTAVTPAQQKQSLCELQLDRGPKNHYRLHGCVTTERQIWPLNFAVNDPFQYAADSLRTALNRLRIRLDGRIRHADNSDDWQPLAKAHSAPLAALIPHMLQESDNLYADVLARTLAPDGAFPQGVRAIHQILADKVGLSVHPSRMVDGSGLSRDDLLSASQLATILRFLDAHPSMVSRRGLPLAGHNGTLKYRRSLLHSPLKGNVQAKSGTLNGSSNLAGYFQAKSGKRYLFVLMISGLVLDTDTDSARLSRYERTLLTHLYNAG